MNQKHRKLIKPKMSQKKGKIVKKYSEFYFLITATTRDSVYFMKFCLKIHQVLR